MKRLSINITGHQRTANQDHSSVQFSLSVVFNSLWPHGLQHTRLSCPSATPGAYSNPCPLSQWCHPAISSSVIPFSSCLQSFPASGPFPMSQFFALAGQSVGASASASVLPMNIQDWEFFSLYCPFHSTSPSHKVSDLLVRQLIYFLSPHLPCLHH